MHLCKTAKFEEGSRHLGVNPLVPRVVLEKPEFSGGFLFKTLFIQTVETIYSI